MAARDRGEDDPRPQEGRLREGHHEAANPARPWLATLSVYRILPWPEDFRVSNQEDMTALFNRTDVLYSRPINIY